MDQTYTLCTSLSKVSSRKVSDIDICRMKWLSSKLRYLYPVGEIHHHPNLGLRTVLFSWRLYSTIVLGILSGNLCRIYLQAVIYGRTMVIVTLLSSGMLILICVVYKSCVPNRTLTKAQPARLFVLETCRPQMSEHTLHDWSVQWERRFINRGSVRMTSCCWQSLFLVK